MNPWWRSYLFSRPKIWNIKLTLFLNIWLLFVYSSCWRFYFKYIYIYTYIYIYIYIYIWIPIIYSMGRQWYSGYKQVQIDIWIYWNSGPRSILTSNTSSSNLNLFLVQNWFYFVSMSRTKVTKWKRKKLPRKSKSQKREINLGWSPAFW